MMACPFSVTDAEPLQIIVKCSNLHFEFFLIFYMGGTLIFERIDESLLLCDSVVLILQIVAKFRHAAGEDFSGR